MSGIRNVIDNLTGNFIGLLRNESRNYVCPIYWLNDKDDHTSYKKNIGSMFCINFNGNIFYVTAWHVFADYIESRILGKSILVFGGKNTSRATWGTQVENLEVHKISRHDVVTFTLPEHPWGLVPFELSEEEWPISPLEIGDPVIVTGYLSQGVKILADGISFLTESQLFTISDITNQEMIFRVDRERFLSGRIDGVDDKRSSLGGLSGSPVVDYDERRKGYRLCGVFQGYGDDKGSDILFRALHSKFIQLDGRINGRGLMRLDAVPIAR